MKALALAAVAALMLGGAAAHAEDFDFNYEGDGGLVTGTVYGLAASGTSQATAIFASFANGPSYTFTPASMEYLSQFTVENGKIVDYYTQDEDDIQGPRSQDFRRWFLALSPGFDYLIDTDASGGDETSSYNTDGQSAVNFTSASAAPEPSAWALMILGLGGIGYAFRRAHREHGFRLRDAFSA